MLEEIRLARPSGWLAGRQGDGQPVDHQLTFELQPGEGRQRKQWVGMQHARRADVKLLKSPARNLGGASSRGLLWWGTARQAPGPVALQCSLQCTLQCSLQCTLLTATPKRA